MMVDSINLASILTDLRMVEKQMEQHSIALISGRLSSEQLSQQLQDQLLVSQVGEVARSNNNLEKEGGRAARKEGKTLQSTRKIKQKIFQLKYQLHEIVKEEKLPLLTLV